MLDFDHYLLYLLTEIGLFERTLLPRIVAGPTQFL